MRNTIANFLRSQNKLNLVKLSQFYQYYSIGSRLNSDECRQRTGLFNRKMANLLFYVVFNNQFLNIRKHLKIFGKNLRLIALWCLKGTN